MKCYRMDEMDDQSNFDTWMLRHWDDDIFIKQLKFVQMEWISSMKLSVIASFKCKKYESNGEVPQIFVRLTVTETNHWWYSL